MCALLFRGRFIQVSCLSFASRTNRDEVGTDKKKSYQIHIPTRAIILLSTVWIHMLNQIRCDTFAAFLQPVNSILIIPAFFTVAYRVHRGTTALQPLAEWGDLRGKSFLLSTTTDHSTTRFDLSSFFFYYNFSVHRKRT